jgi:hypothetical protein
MGAAEPAEWDAGTDEIALNHARDRDGGAKGLGPIVDAKKHRPTQS